MKKLFVYLVSATIMLTAASCSKDDDDFNLPEDVSLAFPDPIFRAYVMANFDTNLDWKISKKEALAVTSIDVGNSWNTPDDIERIKSLEGVQYFTNLKELNCSWNQLTSLDISQNTALTELSCDYNQLTSLDVSRNIALTSLRCYDNQLTGLDVSQNTALTKLYCNNNQLTSLDVSQNTALTTLYCGGNPLTSLDVSKNTALTSLDCDNNQLTSLDVSKNTALEYLDCDYNKLTSLDVSKTNLGNSEYNYPLRCYIFTLETLILKKGWEINQINVNRNLYFISYDTTIEYVD